MIKNKRHPTQHVYKWERHGYIFNHEKEKMRQLWRNGTCFGGYDFAGDSGSEGGAEERGASKQQQTCLTLARLGLNPSRALY